MRVSLGIFLIVEEGLLGLVYLCYWLYWKVTAEGLSFLGV